MTKMKLSANSVMFRWIALLLIPFPKSEGKVDCPSGWTPGILSNRCFLIPSQSKGDLNYYQAQKLCQSYGGTLPEFASEAQFAEYQTLVEDLMKDDTFSQTWLGCTDEEFEGEYRCPTLFAIKPYFRWAKYNNEPNGDVQENCLIGLRWPKGNPLEVLDVSCFSKHQYRITVCATLPCAESPFSAWQSCTTTCGVGTTYRESRIQGCPPQFGACSIQPCPVKLGQSAFETFGMDRVPIKPEYEGYNSALQRQQYSSSNSNAFIQILPVGQPGSQRIEFPSSRTKKPVRSEKRVLPPSAIYIPPPFPNATPVQHQYQRYRSPNQYRSQYSYNRNSAGLATNPRYSSTSILMPRKSPVPQQIASPPVVPAGASKNPYINVRTNAERTEKGSSVTDFYYPVRVPARNPSLPDQSGSPVDTVTVYGKPPSPVEVLSEQEKNDVQNSGLLPVPDVIPSLDGSRFLLRNNNNNPSGSVAAPMPITIKTSDHGKSPTAITSFIGDNNPEEQSSPPFAGPKRGVSPVATPGPYVDKGQKPSRFVVDGGRIRHQETDRNENRVKKLPNQSAKSKLRFRKRLTIPISSANTLALSDRESGPIIFQRVPSPRLKPSFMRRRSRHLGRKSRESTVIRNEGDEIIRKDFDNDDDDDEWIDQPIN